LAATDASPTANISHPVSEGGRVCPVHLTRGFEDGPHNDWFLKLLITHISKSLCILETIKVQGRRSVVSYLVSDRHLSRKLIPFVSIRYTETYKQNTSLSYVSLLLGKKSLSQCNLYRLKSLLRTIKIYYFVQNVHKIVHRKSSALYKYLQILHGIFLI
jgi:hypothetical protein